MSLWTTLNVIKEVVGKSSSGQPYRFTTRNKERRTKNETTRKINGQLLAFLVSNIIHCIGQISCTPAQKIILCYIMNTSTPVSFWKEHHPAVQLMLLEASQVSYIYIYTTFKCVYFVHEEKVFMANFCSLYVFLVSNIILASIGQISCTPVQKIMLYHEY